MVMGGYGFYIGCAYGAVCLIFIANGFSLRWQKRRTRRKLQQRLQRSKLTGLTQTPKLAAKNVFNEGV